MTTEQIKQEEPLVSVVMSVFNGEQFLAEAVESILNQSFRGLEFLIINDGSADGSQQILESYARGDCRIRLHHQSNRGLVDALNRGCALARGKYIARMDADDVSLSDRLARQIDFMERHGAVGVVGGAVEVINATGKLVTTYRNPTNDRDIRSALLHGSPFWHPTVLMRKEALLSVRGYRKVVSEAEDYDLWLRIAEHFDLSNLEAVLLKYRLHPNQSSVSRRKQQIVSTLAARAAASSRKSRHVDPLDSVETLTPQVLRKLGVNEAAQKIALSEDYVWTIRNLCDAGEYLSASHEIDRLEASSGFKHAGRRAAADLHLLAARIHWHNRRLLKAALAVSCALLARPLVVGRPLRPLLHRSEVRATSLGQPKR